MKKLKAAIVGLGDRGKGTYAKCANIFSNRMELVAIADIDKCKVREVAKLYKVKNEMCFNSAEELLTHEKLADIIFIATQDRQHASHTIAALKKGYHVFLEKPISPDISDCKKGVKLAEECGKKVVIGHVLRYTPFFGKIKEVISSGQIGNIVSIIAIENVGYWHHAHSYVRGNWRNSETSSPMILAKCSHDIDLYLWLSDKKCESVSSFGSNFLFKAECAPEGATKRCTDNCKVKTSCPFNAEKIYIDHKRIGIKSGNVSWPLDVLDLHPTQESISEALRTGPYGRCVYYCDNNVVDHQVVNLNMTDGSTVHLTMSAFTSTGSRFAKIMGTKGEIVADMSTNIIKITEFGKETEEIDVRKLSDDFSGHGGGDNRLVLEFLDLIKENAKPSEAITTVEHSIESHFCALAAEQSRLKNGIPIKIDDLRY